MGKLLNVQYLLSPEPAHYTLPWVSCHFCCIAFFVVARAYFDSQMPFVPGGIARYDTVLRDAAAAAITAQALDCTIAYTVAALIGGIWWARRQRGNPR